MGIASSEDEDATALWAVGEAGLGGLGTCRVDLGGRQIEMATGALLPLEARDDDPSCGRARCSGP